VSIQRLVAVGGPFFLLSPFLNHEVTLEVYSSTLDTPCIARGRIYLDSQTHSDTGFFDSTVS